MKIVIDIPEGNYKTICETKDLWETEPKNIIYAAIANGTPLPKGHGKLVDISKIDEDKIESDNPIICLTINGEYTEAISLSYLDNLPTIIEADKENPLDEYIPMVEEMKQMMQGDTDTNKSIKKMLVKGNTDEKIATLTECEESYVKGYEDGRKAGHLEGCRDEYEAMASYLRSVLEELRP